jgi:GH24 family phage-related lysozyme (muramidase)
MAWKMTGQREILQPVIDAYHRGEIPEGDARLIADIAGLDQGQRGLIASKSDHLFSAAAKYTPEQQRLSGGGITARKDGNFPTWVWRTKPDSDVIQNPDGSVSSHLMRHEVTDDGTWIAFPQIQRDESGQLKDYGDEAMGRVLESGNYFKYPDKESAAAYSMGSWKQPGQEPGRGMIAQSDVASSQGDVPLVGDLTTDTSVPVLGEPDRAPQEFPGVESEIGGFTMFKEGFREDVYNDVEGHPSIGYGINLDREGVEGDLRALGYDIDALKSGAQKMSKEDAKAMFAKDYAKAWDGARRVIPRFDSLPPQAQEAFLDMTYNMGPAGVKKFKKMIEGINERDFDKIEREMYDSKWFRLHDELGNDRAEQNIERVRQSFKDWPVYDPNS